MNPSQILIVILSLTILPVVAGANQSPLTIDGSNEESLQKSLETVKQSLPPHQQKKFEQAYLIIMLQALDEKGGENEAFRKALNGKTGPEVIAEVTGIVQDKVRRVQEKQAKKTKHKFFNWIFDEKMGGINGRTSLSCTALLLTRIGMPPLFPSDEERYQISEESFFLDQEKFKSILKSRNSTIEAYSEKGTDKLAIKIRDKTMSLITQASVEVGIAEPAEFSIIRNDKRVLFAIFLDDTKFPNDAMNSLNVDTFLLNKQSGLAFWIKSRSRTPWRHTRSIPENQSHFLRCR